MQGNLLIYACGKNDYRSKFLLLLFLRKNFLQEAVSAAPHPGCSVLLYPWHSARNMLQGCSLARYEGDLVLSPWSLVPWYQWVANTEKNQFFLWVMSKKIEHVMNGSYTCERCMEWSEALKPCLFLDCIDSSWLFRVLGCHTLAVLLCAAKCTKIYHQINKNMPSKWGQDCCYHLLSWLYV